MSYGTFLYNNHIITTNNANEASLFYVLPTTTEPTKYILLTKHTDENTVMICAFNTQNLQPTDTTSGAHGGVIFLTSFYITVGLGMNNLEYLFIDILKVQH